MNIFKRKKNCHKNNKSCAESCMLADCAQDERPNVSYEYAFRNDISYKQHNRSICRRQSRDILRMNMRGLYPYLEKGCKGLKLNIDHANSQYDDIIDLLVYNDLGVSRGFCGKNGRYWDAVECLGEARADHLYTDIIDIIRSNRCLRKAVSIVWNYWGVEVPPMKRPEWRKNSGRNCYDK